MHIMKRVERSLLRKLLPPPVHARHREYSMLFSADDEASTPSRALLSLAVDAIQRAQTVSLETVSARIADPPAYPDVWPGELYKLLAGLMLSLRPTRVVEVGTGGGTSTLTMKRYLPPEGRIVTFDVVGWQAWSGGLLRADDFQDGRLVQWTDDVSQPDTFPKFRGVFESAQLIFIDAAKDGVMEQRLLNLLETAAFPAPVLLVFDDIRLWNMLAIWRAIRAPKLDVTSFGHWTGTGLVEWASPNLRQ